MDKSIPIQVGQRRMMTVPGIHHDQAVEVEIRDTSESGVGMWHARCVSCDSAEDHSDKWWGVFPENDKGFLSGPGAIFERPKKETNMNFAERKSWALAQDWKKHIPSARRQRVENVPEAPKGGEIWAYNDGFHTGVMLITDDCYSVVLAGDIDEKGRRQAFSHNGGRQNYGFVLRAADDFTTSDDTSDKKKETNMGSAERKWKVGDVRRGPIADVRDKPETYQIVEVRMEGSQYDWTVLMLDGNDKGKKYGVKESWGSEIVGVDGYMVSPTQPEKDTTNGIVVGDVIRRDRGNYGDGVPVGTLRRISKIDSESHFYTTDLDGGNLKSHGVPHLEYATLMVPIDPRKAAAANTTHLCGDKSTAYGLLCTMGKSHDGDNHEHLESGARWEKVTVVKLGRCHNSHRVGGDVFAMAVATVVVDTDGEKQDLCDPCIKEREKKIATKMQKHDKENPQPKNQPRYQVSSATLDSGGIINLRG